MYTTNVAADVLICIVGWLCFIGIAYLSHRDGSI